MDETIHTNQQPPSWSSEVVRFMVQPLSLGENSIEIVEGGIKVGLHRENGEVVMIEGVPELKFEVIKLGKNVGKWLNFLNDYWTIQQGPFYAIYDIQTQEEYTLGDQFKVKQVIQSISRIAGLRGRIAIISNFGPLAGVLAEILPGGLKHRVVHKTGNPELDNKTAQEWVVQGIEPKKNTGMLNPKRLKSTLSSNPETNTSNNENNKEG